jgi:hypothetical protein
MGMQFPDPDGLSKQDYVRWVLSLTRTCVQYGIVGFAVACILISALEAALER